MERKTLGRTGVPIPSIGLGTWGIGGGMRSDRSHDGRHVEALRYGFGLGMNLIDTAEMYGAGHSEEVVAEAMLGRRKDVFVATKVSPKHFEYDDVLRSARRSLLRLQVDQIDLYQLHWPNDRIPISKTMQAMERLVHDGLVRHIGVSNFSVTQLHEAQKALSREQIVSNQVEYSVLDRSPEENGVLQQSRTEGITLIAYSPLAQGKVFGQSPSLEALEKIAARNGKTRGQIALNWLIQKEPVIVIPKAGLRSHIEENAGAAGWRLSVEDSNEINRSFG